ncbi:MAG: FkbM family methyltransferase [Planctomycetia bacterium]|nr:FkbM family methyltransferase [Planctomycetia bacterium]
MISYSQNCEDVLLNRLFPENYRGFYVDVGACHPTVGSVTAHFYSCGWSGINVEPSCNFDLLSRERPRDINLQVAVSDDTGSADFYEFPGAPGLSTFGRDLAEFAIHKLGHHCHPRKVPVATLAEICRTHADRPIDFLSIDVEGHEREVLAGADFTQFRPRVIVIEATKPHTGDAAYDGWEPLVLSAGYLFAFFDGLNRFYVRNEDREWIARLAVPANVFDNFVSHELHATQVEAQSMKLQLETLATLRPISAALARRLSRVEASLPRVSDLLMRWRQRISSQTVAR